MFKYTFISPVKSMQKINLIYRLIESNDELELIEFYRSLSSTSRTLRWGTNLSDEKLDEIAKKEITRPNYVAFASITGNGKMVGVCSYYLINDARTNAEIACVVGESTRHQGVGKELLENIIVHARQANLNLLIAKINIQNDAALHLFIQSAKSIHGTIVDLYIDDESLYHYVSIHV